MPSEGLWASVVTVVRWRIGGFAQQQAAMKNQTQRVQAEAVGEQDELDATVRSPPPLPRFA